MATMLIKPPGGRIMVLRIENVRRAPARLLRAVRDRHRPC
jgi:hypothetical protein